MMETPGMPKMSNGKKCSRRWLARIAAAFIFAFMSCRIFASVGEAPPQGTGNCWIDSGREFTVDPFLLFSIAYVESGFDQSAVSNACAVGIMQIRCTHGPLMIRNGVNPRYLETDACYNIRFAAWLLSDFIRKNHGVNWLSVGSYNVGVVRNEKNDRQRIKYSNKVFAAYAELSRLKLSGIDPYQVIIQRREARKQRRKKEG